MADEMSREAHELTIMTDAALGVLLADGEVDRAILDAPPSVLRRMIVEEARSAGLTDEDATVLADGATTPSRAGGVAGAVLTELCRTEPIREELDAAAARRDELMAVDPLTIGAAVLLVAVLKVRRIKISKSKGLDVSFAPLKSEIIQAVLQFLRGGS